MDVEVTDRWASTFSVTSAANQAFGSWFPLWSLLPNRKTTRTSEVVFFLTAVFYVFFPVGILSSAVRHWPSCFLDLLFLIGAVFLNEVEITSEAKPLDRWTFIPEEQDAKFWLPLSHSSSF